MFLIVFGVISFERGSLCVSRDVSYDDIAKEIIEEFALREQGCFPFTSCMNYYHLVRSA